MRHDGCMAIKVRDLQPGDVFVMDGTQGRGTVIITTEHPLYGSPFAKEGNLSSAMALVVWYLHDEARFSFDALAWVQELPGVLMPATKREKLAALRHALTEGQQ